MTNEELVQLYQAGDKKALNTLIEQNLGIVYKLTNKFNLSGSNSIDYDDLIQEGSMGLMIAADKYRFDMDKPCKFITYAVYWVYQKINMFVRSKNTNEETSLNIPTGEGGKEIIEYIEGVDYGFENIEEKLYIQQLRHDLEDLMIKCNTLMEREILQFKCGWNNGSCMTYAEIGEVLGITGGRSLQIECKAMRKIRRDPMGKKLAQEYYGNKFEMDTLKIAEKIKLLYGDVV
jgi:RNA polymerase primary sigma factor/RNA polymerase sporulation-specific sigma factor